MPLNLDEYSDEDIEDILQAIAYHRSDFDKVVAQAPPDLPLTTVFDVFGAPPKSNLGRLGSLPLELILHICLMLDIPSAINFSQVNRRTREIIASTQQFHQLGKHAARCLWLLLRTGLAPHVEAPALYSALTSKACKFCGFFGGFLLLPTVERCCFLCIQEDDRLQPTYLTTLVAISGIPARRIRMSTPVMCTLPGTYSMEEKQVKKRRFVVCAQHAQKVLRDAKVKAPDKWPDTYVLRFMLATYLPYFDPKSGETQSGVACRGCRIAVDDAIFIEGYDERRDRLYSHDEFLLHLRSCEDARDIWLKD